MTAVSKLNKFSFSDFRTRFFRLVFFRLFALKTWSESRVKLYRNDLKENKNYFELAGGSSYGGSSYRGYNYKKCMKEIQGKSTLVLVSEGSSYRESRVN